MKIRLLLAGALFLGLGTYLWAQILLPTHKESEQRKAQAEVQLRSPSKDAKSPYANPEMIVLLRQSLVLREKLRRLLLQMSKPNIPQVRLLEAQIRNLKHRLKDEQLKRAEIVHPRPGFQLLSG